MLSFIISYNFQTSRCYERENPWHVESWSCVAEHMWRLILEKDTRPKASRVQTPRCEDREQMAPLTLSRHAVWLCCVSSFMFVSTLEEVWCTVYMQAAAEQEEWRLIQPRLEGRNFRVQHLLRVLVWFRYAYTAGARFKSSSVSWRPLISDQVFWKQGYSRSDRELMSGLFTSCSCRSWNSSDWTLRTHLFCCNNEILKHDWKLM